MKQCDRGTQNVLEEHKMEKGHGKFPRVVSFKVNLRGQTHS